MTKADFVARSRGISTMVAERLTPLEQLGLALAGGLAFAFAPVWTAAAGSAVLAGLAAQGRFDLSLAAWRPEAWLALGALFIFLVAGPEAATAGLLLGLAALSVCWPEKARPLEIFHRAPAPACAAALALEAPIELTAVLWGLAAFALIDWAIRSLADLRLGQSSVTATQTFVIEQALAVAPIFLLPNREAAIAAYLVMRFARKARIHARPQPPLAHKAAL